MRHCNVGRARRFAHILPTLVIAACGDATGIGMDFTAIAPAVHTLDGWVSGDMMVVGLELQDATIEVPDDARIPVSVRSDGGDAETILARRFACQDEEFGSIVCGRVVIGTTPNDVAAIARRLRSLNAFIMNELGDGTAVIAYFPVGSLNEIRAIIGKWSEVRWVQPDVLFPGASEGRDRSAPAGTIRGYMAIEDTTVIAGNHFLEASSAEAFRLVYAPPGGPGLEKEVKQQ